MFFGFLNNTKEKHKSKTSIKYRDAFDMHLAISFEIEEEYKKRNIDADALNKTIALCHEQIKISEQAKKDWIKENRSLGITNVILPNHKGYKQLAIIFEKQGKLQNAIDIARQAKVQGWAGDWDIRIKRCEQKLLKTNQ
jgi:hypothetical protein